ncbi:MAG: hypothetical protein R3Y43_06365 [Alphaproteobacteria bacterium]
MSSITEEFVHIIGKPKKMVLFLHGYEQDAKLINKLIKPMINNLDNCVVIIPQAPFECEVLPNKNQWYSMHDFDPNDDRKKLKDFNDVVKIYAKSNANIKQAFEILIPYIEEKLKKHKIKAKDLYICGFSQGASLGLYTSLMFKDKIAGAISMSGILCPADVLLDHYKNNFATLLIHGKADDYINFEALDFSKKYLEKIGCVVSTYAIDDTSHFITEDGLLMASHFINAKK